MAECARAKALSGSLSAEDVGMSRLCVGAEAVPQGYLTAVVRT
jgi:hypothetical protein